MIWVANGIVEDFDDTEKGNLVPIETTTVSTTTTRNVITEDETKGS